MTSSLIEGKQAEEMMVALKKFRRSLDYYGRHCLQIKTKDNKTSPFVMNPAQKYLHRRLQQQLKDTGRVRCLVLKGRQQGISTYTGARYYRRASLHKNIGVYILSHKQDATDSLFDMVDRFHRHNPIAPHTGTSNAKELKFDRLDSAYVVATAGAKEGGRGRTSTLFHGSEVAFWDNAPAHFASSVQTVSDAPGTEIILESTANGTSGEYYERWQEAESGVGDYQAIFIPWYWQKEYARTVPHDFELSNENIDGEISEVEYMDMFNLEMEQMVWRRAKIRELRSLELFNQEYPATASMAFQASDTDSYIKGYSVLKARKRDVTSGGPLIMGVDPAGEGGDRFCVCFRRGYKVEHIEWRVKIGAPEAVEWLDELIQRYKPARINVDAGGLGHGVIGFLKAKRSHYPKIVRAINFGSTSQFKMARPKAPGPKYRRDEMWQRMKDWLDLEEGVQIPDIDVLQADLTACRKKPSLTNDFQLLSKDEMRKLGIRSPDLGDAMALTFADLSHITEYVDAEKKNVYGSTGMSKARTTSSHGGGNGWQGV